MLKSGGAHPDLHEIPRKIHVIGPIGSGKSTTAKRLATRLGLKFIELDAIRHGPDWVDMSDVEFRSAVLAEMNSAPHGWVAAGDYFQSLGPLVLSQAEAIIWLRIPFFKTFPKLIFRTVWRSFTREELWNGNRESWRQSFFSLDSVLIEATMKARTRFALERPMLDQLIHGPTVIVLKTYRQIDRFIDRPEFSNSAL